MGHRVMTVVTFAALEHDNHPTMVLEQTGLRFDELAVCYLLVPEQRERCRPLVKIDVGRSERRCGRCSPSGISS